MTKFSTIFEKKDESKKTVFKSLVGFMSIKDADAQPENFDNVQWLGHDPDYGDVFKAWDNDDTSAFMLYFGIKGDEF